jgi:hypothetical protein
MFAALGDCLRKPTARALALRVVLLERQSPPWSTARKGVADKSQLGKCFPPSASFI